jgi:sulfite exporter TauE/SafE/copper chaperone CopZ
MADGVDVPQLVRGTSTRMRVTGMTCASCESRVERALGRLDGVASSTASSRHGRVDIVWSGAARPDEAAATIAAAGYVVGRPPWLTRDRAVWRTAAVAVVVVGTIAVLAQWAGWSRLSSGVGDLAAGGLVLVFLLGLAAGVSTCMALTGGLVLAASAAHTARLDREGRRGDVSALVRLRPVLMVNVGRVVGFTVLGAGLGMLGSRVSIPTQVLAVMMLTVAVVMAVLGMRLTELSPRVAGWTVSLPSSWATRLGLDERAGAAYSDWRVALLGAATFFLPCGFTQAAQIFALSTGSVTYAAMIMGVFALGTAPGLLTLGGLPELLPAQRRTAALRGLGVLVLLFAGINGAAGLRLAGIDPLQSLARQPTATTVSDNVTVSPDLQVLHTTQVTDGYLPVRSVAYAGLPIRWIVESQDPQSCAIELRAPSVGVSVTLVKGINTIELPAQPVGRLMFSCSMGMYGGSITMVERPSA